MADITLSGVIEDSDSIVWANAKVTAVLVSFASPQGKPVRISDGSTVPTVVIGYLDDDGTLDLTLAANNNIAPEGTQWAFSIQPNASTPAQIISPKAYNSSQSIAAAWNEQIEAIRITSGAGMRAYSATEIEGANLGDIFTVTTPSSYGQYIWNGEDWVSVGGGGGFTVSGTPENDSYVPVYDGGASNTATWRQLTQSDILPAFAITLFSGGQNVEIGATISNPDFTLAYSSTPDSVSITNTDGVDSPYVVPSPFTAADLTGNFSHSVQATTTFTATAVKAGSSNATAQQTFNFWPRQFAGVGGAGATGASASGNNATLTGASGTLENAGLTSNPVGTTYAEQNPANQKIYILTIGAGHSFKDSATGFAMAFNSPTAITFDNQEGSDVSMYLYESSNLLDGSFTPEMVS